MLSFLSEKTSLHADVLMVALSDMAFSLLYRKPISYAAINFRSLKTSYTISINKLNRLESLRTFTLSSQFKQEMDELQKNPYFDKYADKIAKLQKTSPEELKSRLDTVEKLKYKSKEKELGKDFSLPTKPKSDASGSQASLLTKEKKLDSIMKVELLRDKDKDEITEIWRLHHTNIDAVSAVIPKEVWQGMEKRFLEYKTFLFPLPRKDGYEFIVVQFLGNSAHFTTLINYQAYQENAPECLTLDHYTDLLDDKGVVLMVGRYDTNLLTIQEAQCLANQVEMYYCNPSEEKRALLEVFTNNPDQFKHSDLIAQLEKIDLLTALPKKDET